MACAEKKDPNGARLAFTQAIENADAPNDVRAMALYNRAILHSAMHNEAEAIRDLKELLAHPGAAASVRLEAKRKLFRMDRASNRPDHHDSPQG